MELSRKIKYVSNDYNLALTFKNDIEKLSEIKKTIDSMVLFEKEFSNYMLSLKKGDYPKNLNIKVVKIIQLLN